MAALGVKGERPTWRFSPLDGLAAAGLGDLPVIVGGIIPASDARALVERGVAAVYTPKDFGLTEIMGGFVDVIRAAHGLDDDR